MLLHICRQLQLPVAIQLELFDILVKPILLYGCEVWATERVDIIEKIHLRFCKYASKQVNLFQHGLWRTRRKTSCTTRKE